MTNMNNNTAAAIENTAATAEKAAPAVWPVRYERMTFGEYLDAIAAGEIAEPVFQRGAVWTEKQNARLLACLLAGRVMPAIIGVSKIPGAMVITRMPNRANSRAAGNVRLAIAPFDAA